MTTPAEQSWLHEAACKDAPGNVFFPTSSGEFGNGRANTLKKAKVYCDTCPVKLECLTKALATDSEGIWGGVHFPSTIRDRRPKQIMIRELLDTQGTGVFA